MFNNNNFAKKSVFATIAAAYPADEKIKNNLKTIRHLTDEQLDRHIISPIDVNAPQKVLASGKIREDALVGIPGFFTDPQTGNVAFHTFYNAQYAILNRDARGDINGIMAKFDSNSTRYAWYSSKGLPDGVSSGAPMGVIQGNRAEDHESIHLAVCEGFFKACAIARTIPIDYVTYTNGVQCSADLPDNITTLSDGHPVSVIMVPDTDCWSNPMVMKATVKILLLTSHKTPNIKVAAWPLQYGKGFDDVLQNGFLKKIHYRPVEAFLSAAHEWALKHNNKVLVDYIDVATLKVMKNAEGNE